MQFILLDKLTHVIKKNKKTKTEMFSVAGGLRNSKPMNSRTINVQQKDPLETKYKM